MISENKKSRYYGVSVLPKKEFKSVEDVQYDQENNCYWGSSIWLDGRMIWLGSFMKHEEELAAKIHDAHMYHYRGITFDSNVYKVNNVLTVEEIMDIVQSGEIPDSYKKRVKPATSLPKGITRRGTKFRICVQSRGRKLEKVVDRLDLAISLVAQFRDETSNS